MNKLLIFALSVTLAATASSGTVTISKGTKKASEYKNHKCIQGVKLAGMLKAELYPEEICRYSKSGCPSIKAKTKITGYCDAEILSQCFEKKAWVSIDQHLQVGLAQEPSLITYGLKKGAENEGSTCAYWD